MDEFETELKNWFKKSAFWLAALAILGGNSSNLYGIFNPDAFHPPLDVTALEIRLQEYVDDHIIENQIWCQQVVDLKLAVLKEELVEEAEIKVDLVNKKLTEHEIKIEHCLRDIHK